MRERSVFTRPFAAALHQACTGRGLTQKQIGELIAVHQHEHRRRGPERERAIAKAKQQWPGRISAWKQGDRLPATLDELYLALDVIAPGTPRRQWETWWAQARQDEPRSPDPQPSQPSAGQPPAVDARHGQGVQLGPDSVQVNIWPAPARVGVRSAYLQQVARIAPPELIDRQTELDDLSRFCLEPGQGPYGWWRAPAWAGKSALMSTFVLHPPEQLRDQVRIVSFFITARLAAQDTREAFTQILLEQLADLTGQDLPPTLSETTREAHLLDLLTQAARTCQAAGGRLVLLVDGLDEDCGVTLGPHAHSIAALLPADPPHDMRVIVAGRPNPPIPDDVPDWHPLRDKRIIRPLTASDYARDLKRLSQTELRCLLTGTPTEQDLLGLLTAARGGLSGPDLEELTGAPLWDIEEILHTVAGRTFTRRVATWDSEHGPETYLLGHEELHTAACQYLGAQRLTGYRDRLHAWATTYAQQGWPTGTPEYLLRGYFRLLTDAGDLPRLVACAADAARHDRMLDLTGGDAAALTEVRTTLDQVVTQDTPDLAAALRLARHRDQLTDRNSNIPTHLPAVWAKLGHHTRAEALATSITDPYRQAVALTRVARALAQAGQHDRAAAVVTTAEQTARSITDPGQQAGALAEVAGALAAVAGALAEAGRHDQAAAVVTAAEQTARSITDPGQQAGALATVAGALAEAGLQDRAETVARHAETVARSISDRGQQAGALTTVAGALATVAGALAEAGLQDRAETVARSITLPDRRAEALTVVAVALARAASHDEAERVVGSINGPYFQAKARAEVAGAMGHAGFDDRSRVMAGQAEDVTRDITWRGNPTAVAVVLAGAGYPEHAERVVSSIIDPYERALALAKMAVALARARHDEAHTVAEKATQVVGSITCEYQQALAMAEVTWALACAGHDDVAHTVAVEAERVARGISDPHREKKSLAELAVALARAGFHDEAERVARDFTDWYGQGHYLPRVAVALARTGNGDAAERVAQSITNLRDRAEALSAVARALTDRAEALAEDGDHGPARTAADQAGRVARTITDSWQQTEALTNVARALTAAGFHDEAEWVARSINDSGSSPPAESRVVKDLIRAGQHGHAERVAMTISDQNDRARALAEVAVAMARAGHCKDAQRVVALAEPLAWRGGSSPSRILRALTDLAVAQSWAGAPAPAQVTASRNGLVRVQAALAGLLAYALVRAWHFSQGQATLAMALTVVVVALAVAKHRDRSCPPGTSGTLVWHLRHLGEYVFDPDEKARAMAEVARALVQAGHHKQAEIMAQSITRPDLREKAMTEVAEARAGHYRRARPVTSGTEVAARPSIGPGLQVRAPARRNENAVRAAVAACSYGEWSSLVGLVLELDPAAVSVIDDLLRPLPRPSDARDVSSVQGPALG